MKETSRENVGRLLPVITEFEKPFWEHLKNRQFMVQKCPECGHVQFPPSPVCACCLSDSVQWIQCSGKATLWSKVRFHKSYLDAYQDVPYSVVFAKLEEGPIITGRMADETATATPFNAPLRITCIETADGTVLLEFVPA